MTSIWNTVGSAFWGLSRQKVGWQRFFIFDFYTRYNMSICCVWVHFGHPLSRTKNGKWGWYGIKNKGNQFFCIWCLLMIDVNWWCLDTFKLFAFHAIFPKWQNGSMIKKIRVTKIFVIWFLLMPNHWLFIIHSPGNNILISPQNYKIIGSGQSIHWSKHFF